jgi:hypothetical protein
MRIKQQAVAIDGSLKDQSLLSRSPASFFFIISLSIRLEASVMLLPHYLPRMSLISEAIIDATLLIAVVSPVLYFLFRPLVVHIRKGADRGCAAQERGRAVQGR